MKVTGFSFIRNALIYDYPIVEAISSILPICDEFVVAVGKSDDNTKELIQKIDKTKIKIIETEWDDSLREGGRVLALETDKAFREISEDSDWAFYIQGDEVVHENYLDTIHKAMLKCKDKKHIDGLLFKYLHFYGSYDFVGDSSIWYNNEIRVIRNNKSIYSYRDAQGFRKEENKKLTVYPIDAYVYHYGWVREPKAMQRKQETFHKHWHSDQWLEKHIPIVEKFDYEGHVKKLRPFLGTHPKEIKKRIKSQNWTFNYDISFNTFSLKDTLKFFLLKVFGIEIGYKNYIKKKI